MPLLGRFVLNPIPIAGRIILRQIGRTDGRVRNGTVNLAGKIYVAGRIGKSSTAPIVGRRTELPNPLHLVWSFSPGLASNSDPLRVAIRRRQCEATCRGLAAGVA